MFNTLWNTCYSAVCQLRFLNERGILVDSLTGFKVNKSLITSNFAFNVHKAYKVEIRFVGSDANTSTVSAKIPYSELIHEMRVGVYNNEGNYAIFNIDLPEFSDVPSLKLSSTKNYSIGSSVATLSFNHGAANLGLKTGILSSVYTNTEGQRFLQYDGMLVNGNSGAPLIDVNTFEVIGISCRRNTPLVKAYNQLMDIISENVSELKKVKEIVKYSNIDPIQVLIANQNQLRQLAKMIYKHSSCGIANAVTLDNILSYFNGDVLMEDVEQFDNQYLVSNRAKV